MDFEYSFSYKDQKILCMEIKPNQNIKGDTSLITECLISDIETGNFVMPIIENVVHSKFRHEIIGGNAFILKIGKKYSTIKWRILDIPDYCTLPTEMFYEILKIWVQEYRKDWESRNK